MTVATIREIEGYALIEDRLQGVGAFLRKGDGLTTDWHVGSDWADYRAFYLGLTSAKFEHEARLQEYVA